MATQSLYRRYRPRRFSELKGQDHVVRALRNAVINEREGQAYLFSGPRGTGKTSSARILAKVLNCEHPVDGEPCCTCPSCLAVEAGTSYDVHELDAASNNGVDAMRDLIEKTMLGTPGRHKVYILDEVHMLSKAAEAALLKTLEEPPPHVVFVLATTDPQKVSETIRSRTQHLQFHLLPMQELEQHVRWVIEDAGMQVTDEAIDAVLRRGGGSARDTLSALELVAASGGVAPEDTPLDEFVESLIESDPGRALAAVAASVNQGRDARTLTESLIAHLRDCFLALMAPDLLQLPDHRTEQVGALAQRLGAAGTVRAIETLGAMLVDMRHAPDPRVLLEVALVKLTNVHADTGTAALAVRVEKLEQALAKGATAVAPSAPARSTPQDPTTGRAVLGGRARRPEPTPTGAVGSSPASPPSSSPAATTATATTPSAERSAPVAPEPSPRPGAADAPAVVSDAAPSSGPAPGRAAGAGQAAEAAPDADAAAPARLGGAAPNRDQLTLAWADDILGTLRPIVKALYAAGRFIGERDGGMALALPNDAHRKRCEEHRADVERAIARHFGTPVHLVLVVDDGSSGADRAGTGSMSRPLPPADEDVDLSELVDAPKDATLSGVERIAAAFPGATVVDEDG